MKSKLFPRSPASTSQKTAVQTAASKELQLPAVAALTKKTCVQQCLLRTLNTILMLREAKRLKETEIRPVAEGKRRFIHKFRAFTSSFNKC